MSRFLEIGAATATAAVLMGAGLIAPGNVTRMDPATAPQWVNPTPASAQVATQAPADASVAQATAETAPATAAPVVLAAAETAPARSGPFGLGREALPEEIAAWDIDIRPDGLGLPPGQGSVMDGEDLYIDQCAVCHGDFGEAIGRWPVLAGGRGTLNHEDPNKTVGSYWPYLSTTWDYVHRAMPFGNAQSLADDEVYAIVAYILYLNDIVDDDFTLTRDNFLEVTMPNADGFFMDDRDTTELPAFIREPCMENCKETVEITARAALIDVTPEEAAAREAREATAELPVTEAPVEIAAAETPAAEPVAAGAIAPASYTPEQIAAGERAFRACAACHKVGEGARNGTGPQLNGVYGQAAGQVDGFRYSNPLTAMAADGLVWDAASLDAFLENPRGFMSGTRMSYSGLKDADQRMAVIAYLSTFTEN